MVRGTRQYWFMYNAQWFSWIIRELERILSKNWWQGSLGKGYVNRTFRMGSEIKVFVPHVNANLRRILILECIWWSIVWMPISPFPQPALSSSSELMNKVTMVARLEIMPRFSNLDFHSPRPTWLQPLLSVWSAISTEHCVSGKAPFLRVISQLHVGRLTT